MKKTFTKNKIIAALLSFLLVFLSVIPFVVLGEGTAYAENETWTDITGTGDFDSLAGIAVDSFGNVYVADSGSHKIKKLSDGVWEDVPGTEDFLYPYGVYVSASDEVYAADSGNNKIKKLSGVVWEDLTGDESFNYPGSIAMDSSGNVYVADSNNHKIKKLSGGVWEDITGTGDFQGPTGIAIDSFDNVYVADSNNSALKKLSDGVWENIPGPDDDFSPYGVAVDSSGNVYVANYYQNTIKKLSDGVWEDITGTGDFDGPYDLTVDNSGNVYVVNSFSGTIKKRSAPMTVTYAAGEHGTISATGETVAHGSQPTAVPAVTPDTGYTFAGWIADGDTTLLSSADVEGETITRPVTYTAHYTPIIYTVTYAAGEHGTIGATAETVAHDSQPAAVPEVTPDAGYTFAGWIADGDTTLLSSADVEGERITGSITYTAYYTLDSYTVRFNSNGGSAVGSQSVTYNTYAVKPTSPTRSGYTFQNWYVDENFATVFDFATTAITEDTNLFAKWSTAGGSNNNGTGETGAGGGGNSGDTDKNEENEDGPSKVVNLILNGLAVQVDANLETTDEGRTLVRLRLTAEQVSRLFAASTEAAIEVSEIGDIVVFELPAAALHEVRRMRPEAALQVIVDGNGMRLPLRAAADAAANATIALTIGRASAADGEAFRGAINGLGAKALVEQPIVYKAEADGRALKGWNDAYQERTMTLAAPADPQQATAVWIDERRQLHFVPSVFANGGRTVTMPTRQDGLYAVIRSERTFVDIAEHWAKADIERMANKRIVEGREAGEFAPSDPVTRAEFAALLVRALGLPEREGRSFTDVPETGWYASAVGTASEAGLIGGYEDGSFRPQERITREQMAVMIDRALAYAGQAAQAAADVPEIFADEAEIAEWAKKSVALLTGTGIIQGLTATEFAPQEGASRAQSAVMINRLLQQLGFVNR